MLEHSNIDALFQALAVSPRRAMVERLGRGPASVSDLAAPFDMTLAAVVQHIQVLEACGIVRTEKIGRVRTCRLEPAALDRLEAWVAERRGQVERRLDRLGQFLDAQDAAMAEKPDGKDH
jgi:DNA-binding transcriptional ArsR family regulator